MGVFQGKSSSLSTHFEAATNFSFSSKILGFLFAGTFVKFDIDVVVVAFRADKWSKVSGVAPSVG